MEKIISYPLSAIAYFLVLLCLLIFHPIQWICYNWFGYKVHTQSVVILNWFLLRCTNVLVATYSAKNVNLIPIDKPVIFVSNHQSMFDVSVIIWFLRKSHPKFVSKKELGKGIPSVSYNLRKGGSVLINRKDPKQALPAIKSLGEYIQKHNRSAVIFPEGTRSKDGKPKAFSENGVKMLVKYAPDAYVVPLTINNSWKLFKFGFFPNGLGAKISLFVHEPIKVSDYDFKTLFEKTHEAVISKIK